MQETLHLILIAACNYKRFSKYEQKQYILPSLKMLKKVMRLFFLSQHLFFEVDTDKIKDNNLPIARKDLGIENLFK